MPELSQKPATIKLQGRELEAETVGAEDVEANDGYLWAKVDGQPRYYPWHRVLEVRRHVE